MLGGNKESREAYEQFICDKIREINSTQTDMNKNEEDNKVTQKSTVEECINWFSFRAAFKELENHTFDAVKDVLKDKYNILWCDLSEDRKGTVRDLIRDYWYIHDLDLAGRVKEWAGSIAPRRVPFKDLTAYLKDNYCIEFLCLCEECRHELFYMTLEGQVYKQNVLKKFSDWLSNAFLSASVPTFEYSLDHIAAVEGVDVASISNEIKEKVKKMLDERTKEIEMRGKVKQKRDSKGRFISSNEERKIKLAPGVYADSLKGVYTQLLRMEEVISSDIYDVERVMLFIREAGCLVNDREITVDELEALLKERFGYTCMCDVLATSDESDGKTSVAVRIPHRWYFTGCRDDLVTVTLNFIGRGTIPYSIEYPEPQSRFMYSSR